jgi:hypothetical protein
METYENRIFHLTRPWLQILPSVSLGFLFVPYKSLAELVVTGVWIQVPSQIGLTSFLWRVVIAIGNLTPVHGGNFCVREKN